ncbi:ParA family protein [Polynucleobacter sp. MWH-UH35A]|uniref:ParA family protein n=1 Tax=Polynucleobacter sp. MWH-UH35A TaxID=1855619 RepID=UPI001BFED107|nr:ParA family protein [Polynucleobacter sp. MWH-UH35A]QWD59706.1 ParA family protein [Polynucleobacter sp. MWH-UH35A]
MPTCEPIKILVTNQKGGVGKSTISANLAAYLAIQESLEVSLIDFDRQASSSHWTKKAPDIGIRVSQAEINYQSTGLALLSARANLRKYSSGAQISICDFTWTPAMSQDFMMDFDMVLIPSSSAKFEMASTEIFILEYVQKRMARLAANKQILIVVPSRVDQNYASQGAFTNLDFLANCFVAPPVHRTPEIDSYVYQDFFCVCSDKAVADNFSAFGRYIAQKISERKEAVKTLSISGPSINREISKKVSVLDDYRKRAKNLGFYGGAAMAELKQDSNPDTPQDASTKTSVGNRFVPGFLRKNQD